MIKKIRHKGLKHFFENGVTSGLQQQQIRRIRLILTRLDAAKEPKDMNLTGLRLHGLLGKWKDFYAVTVQANWRIIFRFDGVDVDDVDLIDYH